MTESQAKKFEKLLDATLKIFNRWEKESLERDARFDREHEETMRKLAEFRKDSEPTSQLLAKWKAEMKKENVGKIIWFLEKHFTLSFKVDRLEKDVEKLAAENKILTEIVNQQRAEIEVLIYAVQSVSDKTRMWVDKELRNR